MSLHRDAIVLCTIYLLYRLLFIELACYTALFVSKMGEVNALLKVTELNG